jgi:hypothetical protein
VIDRLHRQTIAAALRAAAVPPEKVGAVLAMLDNKEAPTDKTLPLAVSQARVCELLDCSRFHVRKLVKLDLLKPRDVGGLTRYAVADVVALLAEPKHQGEAHE